MCSSEVLRNDSLLCQLLLPVFWCWNSRHDQPHKREEQNSSSNMATFNVMSCHFILAVCLPRDPDWLYSEQPSSGVGSNSADIPRHPLKQGSLAQHFKSPRQSSKTDLPLTVECMVQLPKDGHQKKGGRPINQSGFNRAVLRSILKQNNLTEGKKNPTPDELYALLVKKGIDVKKAVSQLPKDAHQKKGGRPINQSGFNRAVLRSILKQNNLTGGKKNPTPDELYALLVKKGIDVEKAATQLTKVDGKPKACGQQSHSGNSVSASAKHFSKAAPQINDKGLDNLQQQLAAQHCPHSNPVVSQRLWAAKVLGTPMPETVFNWALEVLELPDYAKLVDLCWFADMIQLQSPDMTASDIPDLICIAQACIEEAERLKTQSQTQSR